MTKDSFTELLLGRDLRTVRQNSIVVKAVRDQQSFDALFELVFHHERPLVMKAVDAVEKITVKHPEFLNAHKAQLMSVLRSADHKELKWHIAQLLPRVTLTKEEVEEVWNKFAYWVRNRNESKIVRANALQGLFEIAAVHPELQQDYNETLMAVEHEQIPSLQARIRKLRGKG